MKIKVVQPLLICMLLCFLLEAYGQKHSSEIIITGTINKMDSTSLLKDCKVSVFTGSAMDPVHPVPGSVISYSIVFKDNNFKLVLPVQQKYAYVQVNVAKVRDLISNGFPLMVAGDSLHIEFTKDGNYLTGNCKTLLEDQFNFNKRLTFTRGYVKEINQVKPLFASFQKVLSGNMLKACQNIKEIELVNLLKFEKDAKSRIVLFSNLYRLKNSTDTFLRKMVLAELEQMNLDWIGEDELTLNYSLNYLRSVFSYFELKETLGVAPGRNYFSNLYHAISSMEASILRDKLLVYLFWRKYEMSGDQGHLISKALKAVKNQECKKILQQVAEAKQKGAKAFDFELTDTVGRMVRLADFKGKAIVVHFWFTGCEACGRLSEQMEPIFLKYKHNPDLVFLSVNVDRKAGDWIKSLKTEKYSNTLEIPLNTKGLGTSHPMIEHYNLISYPRIMIINKLGLMVSANAPIVTEKKKAIELIELIDQALTK